MIDFEKIQEEERKKPGDSNTITRKWLDSLLVETRYMNAVLPSTQVTIFGETFDTPIATAALSHLGAFLGGGDLESAFAAGAKDAGALCFYGMCEDEEIDRMADTGAKLIEIIKPYADRQLIYDKIAHAEEKGFLAVGIDIDHSFNRNGGYDEVFGYDMRPISTEELTQICRSTALPVVIKGVLSTYDAIECVKAGAKGLVVSHHSGRVPYSVPPMAMLPEIRAAVGSDIVLFTDCCIASGMDAFKALAMGADAVCIGKALMPALREEGAEGVRNFIAKATTELAYVMGCTGCPDVASINEDRIH